MDLFLKKFKNSILSKSLEVPFHFSVWLTFNLNAGSTVRVYHTSNFDPFFDIFELISKFWTKVTLVHKVRLTIIDNYDVTWRHKIPVENLSHFRVTFWHRCDGNAICIYTVMTQYCKNIREKVHEISHVIQCKWPLLPHYAYQILITWYSKISTFYKNRTKYPYFWIF